MITSTGNAQIKTVSGLVKKAKDRREQGLFIVEGIKMFRELPKENLKKAYVSESFLKQLERQGRISEGKMLQEEYPCEIVSDEVMKYMSDTQSPQGILAVAKQFSYTLKGLLEQKANAHLMILETLQDPGNLGTIIRAGEGAGVTGIIMNTSTADIYNPKVIRSTMGSVYRVPFVYAEDLKAALNEVKQAGIYLFAAHLKGNSSYDKEDYCKSTGFLIGNEANGLSEELSAMADRYVKIPMAGKVESLNAAVAASILMFETARQRRG